MRITRCRLCGADIFWAEATAGKRMPIDVVPREDGNLYVYRNGDMIACEYMKAEENRPRYTSHFATCPEAKKWRSQ